MDIPSYVAASRQITLQQSLENTAFNLSAQSISGYQSNQILFNQYVKDGVSYVEAKGNVRDLKPGPVIQTDNPLHLSISGLGYFAVQDKSGDIVYTRGGTFQLNADRFMVTPQGDYVLDQGQGPISIPETSQTINIGSDGTIADQDGLLATVGVFNFENQQDMQYTTEGYLKTTQEGQVIEVPTLIQGAYEGSNVNPIIATLELTSINHEYQQNMKVIEERNKMVSDANQRLVKLAPAA